MGASQTLGALTTEGTQAYTSPTQQVTGVASNYFSVTLSQPFVYTSGNLLVLSDHEKQGTASTTTTTASLSCLMGSTGTYAVVYGPTGFNPATGGTTVSGLTPGTTYQFYVTLNCAADANSGTAGPATFTTKILNDEPCGADCLHGRDASTTLSMTLIIQN